MGVLLAVGGGTVIYETHKVANHPQPVPAAAGGPVYLRIKWTVGKKYEMHMEIKQSSETQVPGQPQPIGAEVNLGEDLDYSVLQELADGGQQLEMQFADETLGVTQGSRKILGFDSTESRAQDANNPIAPMFRLLSEARIQYFIDTNGTVAKVEGLEDLMNRAAAGGKSQMQAVFTQIFNEGTLKQYGALGEFLPHRTVNIGDSWSLKKDSGSSVGIVTLNMKFTFINWERHDDRQCAHIKTTGDISTKTISTATGAAVQIKKGTISGDTWFDPQQRMIVEENYNQDLVMNITIRAKTMTSDLKQNTRWALLSVE
jgi:hypothetical protein